MSALNDIAVFETKKGRGQWPYVDRFRVAAGLRERIADPGVINQGGTPLCGPAAFIYCVARGYPEAYVKYVTDLYDYGKASLWGFAIEASENIRNSQVPLGIGLNPEDTPIGPVDWIGLATLRDSEGWIQSYDGFYDGAAGLTMPGTLASWFEKASYGNVRDRASFFTNKSQSDIEAAGSLHLQGHDVCLLISSKMLRSGDQHFRSTVASHWVVLSGPVVIRDGSVSFTVYTWGEAARRVPQSGKLPIESFHLNFYGYVAAK